MKMLTAVPVILLTVILADCLAKELEAVAEYQHDTVVALLQDVVAHRVDERASVGVAYLAPKLRPDIVTDNVELVTMFGVPIKDTVGLSKVKTLLEVPTIDETVMIRSAGPGYARRPPAEMHWTIEFVVHEVVGQSPISKNTAVGVALLMPKLTPPNVRVPYAELAMFLGVSLVTTGASYENLTPERVPTTAATVTTKLFLPPVP